MSATKVIILALFVAIYVVLAATYTFDTSTSPCNNSAYPFNIPIYSHKAGISKHWPYNTWTYPSKIITDAIVPAIFNPCNVPYAAQIAVIYLFASSI